MKANIKENMAITRQWSIITSATPVLVVLSFLFWKTNEIRPWTLTAASAVSYTALYILTTFSKKYIPGLMTVVTAASAIGMTYAATGICDWSVLLPALPVGIISEGILKARTAHAAGMNTKKDAILYSALMMIPYIGLGVVSMAGLLPVYTVFTFLTIAIAIACTTTMFKNLGQGDLLLADLEARTSNLQIIFSIILSASLIIARFF